MSPRSACNGVKANGEPCRTAPLVDGEWCLMHDPEKQEEAAEARRLGGQRRRRERVLLGAYDFEGLESIASIRRLLVIAATDTLGLDNGVQRNRTLTSIVMAAAKLLEVGEMEERLSALEEVLGARTKGGSRR